MQIQNANTKCKYNIQIDTNSNTRSAPPLAHLSISGNNTMSPTSVTGVHLLWLLWTPLIWSPSSPKQSISSFSDQYYASSSPQSPPPDGFDVSWRPLGLLADRSIMELIPDLPQNNGQRHLIFSPPLHTKIYSLQNIFTTKYIDSNPTIYTAHPPTGLCLQCPNFGIMNQKNPQQ